MWCANSLSLVCLFCCNWSVNGKFLLIKHLFFITEQYRTPYSLASVEKLLVSCVLPNLVVHNRVRKSLSVDRTWTKWIQSTKYTVLKELKLLRTTNYWISLNTFSNSKWIPFFPFQNTAKDLELNLSVLAWESILKIKIFLCLIKHHTLSTRGEVRYSHTYF
jgi:hypothetical protein